MVDVSIFFVNENNLFSDSLTETDVRCAILRAAGAISRRKCEWINFNVVHSCRAFTSKNSAKTMVQLILSSLSYPPLVRIIDNYEDKMIKFPQIQLLMSITTAMIYFRKEDRKIPVL